MKFSCSRSVLLDALSVVSDIPPQRSVKPILQNLCMRGNSDGTITLLATDLEIGIAYTFKVDSLSDPVTTLLPAAKLFGLIRDEWSESVEISIENDKAKITTANGSFHLLGMPPEEFPPMETIKEDQEIIEINGSDLSDAISKTIFSTAKSDTRYALNGILIHAEKNNIEFVSSDTHRLSLSRKKSRTTQTKQYEAIVISKGMATIGRISGEEEIIKLQITNHELIAQTSQATVVTRLVDGQFPRYKDVIPNNLEKKVTVSREMLIRSLRLGGQITNEETHSVSFVASGDKVLVNSAGNESGDGRIEIDAEVEGDEISANFNYTYLIDVLRILEDEKISIQFKDSENPARIDVKDYTHIIMPIKPRG